MKIEMNKNLVEFTPESADEKNKLEALWKTIVDCVRFNKKLVPIGRYIPAEDKFARFAIEGYDTQKNSGETYPEVYADNDCRCYCQTCNKYVELKKGDRIPPCCGKLMEVLD
ncbi:MAG: hypothetical protein KKE44_11930 [Proteobacteria bacterium]|nr:hypothetical protein [Pseudomonadota bacterium]MBU1583434.1 hypothetical protein [Pseudomonadota bacterium]MBU2452118.1 hypothetical protein [Pseudomonadota bacterium]